MDGAIEVEGLLLGSLWLSVGSIEILGDKEGPELFDQADLLGMLMDSKQQGTALECYMYSLTNSEPHLERIHCCQSTILEWISPRSPLSEINCGSE